MSVLFLCDCRICGLPLLNISRLPVCPNCLGKVQCVHGNVCSICGERVFLSYAVPDSDGLLRCPVCRSVVRPFGRAVAYGSYDGGLRELIHLLKHNGMRSAASVLGRMLAECLSALGPAFERTTVLVIPVSLYKGKRRHRGFNQAELITKAASKVHPARERCQLATGVVERTRGTHSQVGLSNHQRRENMRGAFVMRAPPVTGRDVLLVEDVYTTDTTVSECARVLGRAGAGRVWVAIVARTMKPAPNGEGFKETIAPRDLETLKTLKPCKFATLQL